MSVAADQIKRACQNRPFYQYGGHSEDPCAIQLRVAVT